MSLSVDTDNIALEVKKIDKYIKEYIENNNDIFYELSKLNSYWKDENSVLFEEKITKEKENNLFVIDNLNKFSNLYKEIQNVYDKKI